MHVSSCALSTPFALFLAFSISTVAFAQSGGQRYAPPVQRAIQQPQGSGSQTSSKTAMGGYCAVCLVEARKWNKGDSRFASNYDGRQYLFPSSDQKAMFDVNPTKYAPVLAGDDVVAFAQTGQRVPGVLANGISYKDRYYFFANAKNKQAFQASPEQFANADLAFGGDCIVCKVEMNHKMAGDPSIVTLHNGLRYQFPDAKAQQAFVSNPVKYAQAASNARSSTQQPQGSGNGSGSH